MPGERPTGADPAGNGGGDGSVDPAGKGAGPAATGFDRVWRPTIASRVVGWVIAAVAVLLAVSALATALGGGIPLAGAALVVVVNVVVALAAWRWGSYPLVGAADDGLTIRNPLRTVVIPWDDVAGARASSLGLTVVRLSGEQVVAWAVTRSSLSTWLNRPSQSDEVVAYLAARVFGEEDAEPA
jgi:Bacterial PH domain